LVRGWRVIACDRGSRDIDDLLARNILVKDVGGGRSTSYSLAEIDPVSVSLRP
jgi:hypothetical protein